MKNFDPFFPIGDTLILGIEGPTLSDREKLLLNIIRPAGIIFFKRNFSNREAWVEDIKYLISSIREVTEGRTKIFSIDYEGGRVHRFPKGAPEFPYAKYWASQSYKVGLDMANFLNSVDINLTYAPCVDIDLESTNPVIGERSFSNDPNIVDIAGLEMYKAFEEKNIISCAKHFPGHGRTTLDSHFELPVIDTSIEDLALDLLPFKSLISANIPLVMSSHIIFTALDSDKPASLSPIVLTDLLRTELNFKGLICSDDFDMKALASIPKKERYLEMLASGTNLVVIGNGMDGKSIEDAIEILNQIETDDKILNHVLEFSSKALESLHERYQLI